MIREPDLFSKTRESVIVAPISSRNLRASTHLMNDINDGADNYVISDNTDSLLVSYNYELPSRPLVR